MDEKAKELMKKIEGMSDEEKRLLAELLGRAGVQGQNGAGGETAAAAEAAAEAEPEREPAEKKRAEEAAVTKGAEEDDDYDINFEDDYDGDYDDTEEDGAEDDEEDDEEKEVYYSSSGSGCSDSMETGGMLLVGAGVASGLLGLALDNKPLKTAGVVGTVLGGLILIAND